MHHQIGRKKLNRKAPHTRAMLRNQVIGLILNGHMQSTKPRVKETQRLAERIVTIARAGWEFNTIRRIKAMLPYNTSAVEKIIKEIAPKYVGRPGGYTRVISLGRRESDTAPMARIEWV